MTTHWTYQEVALEADLAQGDILVRTDALRDIFEAVHPHFLDAKYTAFLVTTQSCDLVRRNGNCGTRYLSIAVVRQLEDVLHELLADICTPLAERVYAEESRRDARLLLQRLFNQNEQSLGLFYLHTDGDAGITVPSVAILRVGLSLRVDHYEALVQARRGRLGVEFTAKLGWLVGNLYSRVGTPDWSSPQTVRIVTRSRPPREVMDEAAAEVERLRLTDEEREAIERAIAAQEHRAAEMHPRSWIAADIDDDCDRLRALLERTR